MGFLKNSRAYLSGPIDNVTDVSEHCWRDTIKDRLRKMGVKVFDPVSVGHEAVSRKRAHIDELKAAGNWSDVKAIMKPVVRLDLRAVDISDFIIVWLPAYLKTIGTIHEIIIGNLLSKPTLICCPDGIDKIPNWLFGITSRIEYLFESIDELVKYLEHIDIHGPGSNNQWTLIHEFFKPA